MKVKEEFEYRSADAGYIYDSFEYESFFRFPLAVCLGSRINVSESLNLYSDLAFWNWRHFSGGNQYVSDLWFIYHWPLEKDTFKFSGVLITAGNWGRKEPQFFICWPDTSMSPIAS